MKKKSNNLKALERKRWSILTGSLVQCYICKQPATDIHEVYGGCNRRNSMLYGFCVPLCRNCHQRATFYASENLKLKVICQKEFEKNHSRAEFMEIIGRNYL